MRAFVAVQFNFRCASSALGERQRELKLMAAPGERDANSASRPMMVKS